MKLEDLSKDELLDIIDRATDFGGEYYIEKALAEHTKLCEINEERWKNAEKKHDEALERFNNAFNSLASKYGGMLIDAPEESVRAVIALHGEVLKAQEELAKIGSEAGGRYEL